MVDPDRARRLLEALGDYRDRLSKLRDAPRDTYLSEEALAGRYCVQAAGQICIDVANHVVSSEGWRTPRDFGDAFTVLEENEVIESTLAERLRSLAGLRNRLVHAYEDIDDGLIYDELLTGLDDLDAFARAITKLIQAEH